MIRFPQSRRLFCAVVGLALCALASGCAQERPASVAAAPDTERVTAANPDNSAPISPPTSVKDFGEPAPAHTKIEAGVLAPLDASCAVDSDCEVKDVGNCCGRMPACVNRAAQPHDAAAVQRECERTGTSSICGFQELSGCRCEANLCVGIPSIDDGAGDVR